MTSPAKHLIVILLSDKFGYSGEASQVDHTISRVIVVSSVIELYTSAVVVHQIQMLLQVSTICFRVPW
jgi:hypothetical protein